MKKKLAIAAAIFLLILFWLFLSAVSAQVTGDVGTVQCQNSQASVQQIIAANGPYANLGILVGTAAEVLSTVEGITDACASCILEQFSQNLPIDSQTNCGPVLSADVCPENTFTCICGPEACGNCGVGGDPGDTDCVAPDETNSTCLYKDGFCTDPALGCFGDTFVAHGWNCRSNLLGE